MNHITMMLWHFNWSLLSFTLLLEAVWWKLEILLDNINNICFFNNGYYMQRLSWDGDSFVWGWLDVEIKTSPDENLPFTSWLVTWGACSLTIAEVEAPSSECFYFSCCGLVGRIVVSPIIGMGWVSIECLWFVISNIFFYIFFSMTSWDFFFLVDFLPRLCIPPITTMINSMKIVYCAPQLLANE